MNLPPKIDGIYTHKGDCDCELCSHDIPYGYATTKRRPDVKASPTQPDQPASERNE